MRHLTRLEPFLPIFGLVGLIADGITIANFVASFWGLSPPPTSVVVALIGATGILALWLVCFVLYRRVRRSAVLDSKGSPIERAQSQRARIAALTGMVAIPLAGFLTLAGWGSFQLQPHDEVTILVTQIDGPDPERYGVTETVLHNLRSQLFGLERVRVQYLARAISESEGSQVAEALGARPFGVRNDATVVIWGWYRCTRTHVQVMLRFELLQDTADAPPIQTGKLTTHEIAEMDSFTVQTRLSERMVYLTAFVAGLANYAHGDYQAAEESYDTALSHLDAGSQALGREVILLHRGLARYQQGEYHDARADFTTAIQTNPQYADAWNNRGLVYSDLSVGAMDPEIWYLQARADYNRAILLAPDCVDAYSNRGVLYSRYGLDDYAIEDFSKAMDIDPSFAPAYHNRASVYSYLADYERAISDYTQAIRIDKGLSLAYLGRGLAYRQIGDAERAKADLQSYIKLSSPDEWWRRDLARDVVHDIAQSQMATRRFR